MEKEKKGIGGFLLFIVSILFLSLLGNVITGVLYFYEETKFYEWVFSGSWILLIIIFNLYILFLLIKKKENAHISAAFYFMLYIVESTFFIISSLYFSNIFPYLNGNFTTTGLGYSVFTGIFCFIYITYLLNSKRVFNTYPSRSIKVLWKDLGFIMFILGVILSFGSNFLVVFLEYEYYEDSNEIYELLYELTEMVKISESMNCENTYTLKCKNFAITYEEKYNDFNNTYNQYLSKYNLSLEFQIN